MASRKRFDLAWERRDSIHEERGGVESEGCGGGGGREEEEMERVLVGTGGGET